MFCRYVQKYNELYDVQNEYSNDYWILLAPPSLWVWFCRTELSE